MFYTYVLYAEAFNKIYVGFTSNLQGRVEAHNHPLNKGYTRKYQPWRLLYSETFLTKAEAMQRGTGFHHFNHGAA